MFVVVFVSAISHHLLVENVPVFAINLSPPGNFLPVFSLFFLFSTHLVVFPLFGAFNILFIYFKIVVSNVNYRHPGTRAGLNQVGTIIISDTDRSTTSQPTGNHVWEKLIPLLHLYFKTKVREWEKGESLTGLWSPFDQGESLGRPYSQLTVLSQWHSASSACKHFWLWARSMSDSDWLLGSFHLFKTHQSSKVVSG